MTEPTEAVGVEADDGRRPTGSVLGLAVANYAAQAISFITGPLIARAIGPSGRGAVAAVSAYDEATTRLFNVGVPEAIGYANKERLASPAALLGTARVFGVACFPVALLVGWIVVAGPLRSLTVPARVLAFLLVAMSPVVNTFGLACRQLLISMGELHALRVVTMVTNTVTLVIVITGTVLDRLTIPVVIATIAAGNLMTHLIAWRLTHVRPEDAAPLRPLLRFGVRALPGSLSDLANNRLDQLLIAPLLGFRQLGFYAVAVGVNFIPIQLGFALSSGAFSRVRATDPRGPSSAASHLIRRAWVVGILASLAVAVVAPVGLPLLYGPRFRASVVPTLLLLPGTVAYVVNLVVRQVANALGRPSYSSAGQLVALALTVAALPIVVPTFGIGGAAVVSSLTYGTRLAITQTLLRRDGVTGTVPGRSDVAAVYRAARRRLPVGRRG